MVIGRPLKSSPQPPCNACRHTGNVDATCCEDAVSGVSRAEPDIFYNFRRPQRSRGLSWSPSNYEELGWKRYFLMSEWDQNGTRTSVAIDINTRLPSVAIMYPLWLPHSHNVADFCAFLTYFYHLSHTAVTVIIQTGPSRVPNLPHI